jgi:hypothetical protein
VAAGATVVRIGSDVYASVEAGHRAATAGEAAGARAANLIRTACVGAGATMFGIESRVDTCPIAVRERKGTRSDIERTAVRRGHGRIRGQGQLSAPAARGGNGSEGRRERDQTSRRPHEDSLAGR